MAHFSTQQRIAIVAAVGAAAYELHIKPPCSIHPPPGQDAAEASLPTSVVKRAHELLRQQSEAVWQLGPCDQWLHPHNAGRSIQYWWQHFTTYLNVNDMYEGTHHTHKYDITAQQLDRCIQEVSKEWHPTIMDACLQNEYIHGLLQETGCTERYLWNAMLMHDTTFGKFGLVQPKQPFTAKLKAQRVAYCQHMHQLFTDSPEEMQKIFWIDQKVLYLVSDHHGVHRWCQRRGSAGQSQAEVLLECPMMDKRYKTWRLYLYLVVNAHLGTFRLFKMCSGTHGVGAEATPYTVGPCACTTTLLQS
jgi:hypothetical protein